MLFRSNLMYNVRQCRLNVPLYEDIKYCSFFLEILICHFSHDVTGIYERNGSERVMLFLPLYHMFGIVVLFSSLFVRNTIILADGFTIPRLVAAVKRCKVDHVLQSLFKFERHFAFHLLMLLARFPCIEQIALTAVASD